MDDTTYNGWTNRPTWLVNLHLSNDHATYLDVRRMVADGVATWRLDARANWSGTRNPGVHANERESLIVASELYRAAEHIRSYVEDMVSTDGATDDPATLLATDLLGTALSSVEWPEIASGWVADVTEDDDPYNVECSGCTETLDARTCDYDPADSSPYCATCAIDVRVSKLS